MGLSTHILDTERGCPAAGVPLALAQLQGDAWRELGRGSTDHDGRCRDLLGEAPLEAGVYRLRFATASYYEAHNVTGLYPYVEIAFTVADPSQHYHIPLLLTANGYTTYRGS
jgi:5-hydroxyisourate hydrolase